MRILRLRALISHKKETPDQSANRTFEVMLHFSGNRVNRDLSQAELLSPARNACRCYWGEAPSSGFRLSTGRFGSESCSLFVSEPAMSYT